MPGMNPGTTEYVLALDAQAVSLVDDLKLTNKAHLVDARGGILV